MTPLSSGIPLQIFKRKSKGAPLNILGGAGSQRAAVTKAQGKSGFLLPPVSLSWPLAILSSDLLDP